MVLAIGILFSVAGAALLVNAGGLGDLVIRRVTSRNLGELAPGYAASPNGFRVYAILVLAIGVAVAGLGLTSNSPLLGATLLGLGVVAFAVASVVAIVGEVRTFRALPPRDRSTQR